jgi:two-component system, NtrC family, response regulator AtoC
MNKVARALIVEDDPAVLHALTEFVASVGFNVRTAEGLEKARSELKEESFDVVLSDLQLPDGSALDLLRELESPPTTDIVLITGHASVDTAVEAFRGGVIDYLTKPIDMARLQKILANVQRTAQLRLEVNELRDQLREFGRFGPMVGSSRPMQVVYDQIVKVAPTGASVLVMGETGTGKELVAQAIHDRSPRSRASFIAVNCGAISSSLIESELFGHERGSFTGATRLHQGLFEQANGGTLFLDEITEMPIELQVKLLRTLETGTIRRIGANRNIDVDVRVVAASNRDPDGAVASGNLREDLLYRLNVFPILLPPLRDRGGDVGLIAAHVLKQLNRDAGTSKTLRPEALEALSAYSWPGNVRELKNLIERAFILATDEIGPEMLPFAGDRGSKTPTAGQTFTVRVGMSIASAERSLIEATLEQTQGDKKRAARLLGISLKTLYNRLNAYGSGSGNGSA